MNLSKLNRNLVSLYNILQGSEFKHAIVEKEVHKLLTEIEPMLDFSIPIQEEILYNSKELSQLIVNTNNHPLIHTKGKRLFDLHKNLIK